jgi:hypothetical protein
MPAGARVAGGWDNQADTECTEFPRSFTEKKFYVLRVGGGEGISLLTRRMLMHCNSVCGFRWLALYEQPIQEQGDLGLDQAVPPGPREVRTRPRDQECYETVDGCPQHLRHHSR